jgi:hypothetical protein
VVTHEDDFHVTAARDQRATAGGVAALDAEANAKFTTQRDEVDGSLAPIKQLVRVLGEPRTRGREKGCSVGSYSMNEPIEGAPPG